MPDAARLPPALRAFALHPLVDSVGVALAWATVLALGGLFVVGVVKARVAKHGWLGSGLENMLIAGVGGVIAWLIGDLVGAAFV